MYDGVTVTDAGKPGIDHMVPLANAWRSGAGSWTGERRKEFANDLTRPQLPAVSAATNLARGDQSPDERQPPVKTYWRTYARHGLDEREKHPPADRHPGGEGEADRDAGNLPLMTLHQPDGTPNQEAGPAGAVPLTAHVKAGPGGAMTDEVGVITGDVTLTTRAAPDSTARVRIQYTGAEEWYTLTGSPVSLPPAGLAAFHARVVEAVRAGGAAEVPDTIS